MDGQSATWKSDDYRLSKSACEESFGRWQHLALEARAATRAVAPMGSATGDRRTCPSVERLLRSAGEAGCTQGKPSSNLRCSGRGFCLKRLARTRWLFTVLVLMYPGAKQPRIRLSTGCRRFVYLDFPRTSSNTDEGINIRGLPRVPLLPILSSLADTGAVRGLFVRHLAQRRRSMAK
jgi:hypothetical protein